MSEIVERWFQVDRLEVERLLRDWRWLYSSKATLLARNVYGELFLRDETGAVAWLNTTTGQVKRVADSVEQFAQMAKTAEKRQEWFVETEAAEYAERGLTPNSSQCIGFGVPATFAEGGTPDTAYVADIYDCVSFLGDLHRQIADSPNGTKVKLVIKNLKRGPI